MNDIEEFLKIDSDILLKMAAAETDTFLGDAIDCIDRELGDGYAKAHPELISGFMKAMAISANTDKVLQEIQPILLRFLRLMEQKD